MSIQWAPFTEWFPNFTKDSIPNELKDIKPVPLSQLISNLHRIRNLQSMGSGWPWWVYFIIIAVVISVITIVAILLYAKLRIKFVKNLSAKSEFQGRRHIRSPAVYSAVPTTVGGGENADGLKKSTPLYPSLFLATAPDDA